MLAGIAARSEQRGASKKGPGGRSLILGVEECPDKIWTEWTEGNVGMRFQRNGQRDYSKSIIPSESKSVANWRENSSAPNLFMCVAFKKYVVSIDSVPLE